MAWRSKETLARYGAVGYQNGWSSCGWGVWGEGWITGNLWTTDFRSSTIGDVSGAAGIAAAVVGCITGPVAAGRLLPFDGDFDVQAEHPGNDCRG